MLFDSVPGYQDRRQRRLHPATIPPTASGYGSDSNHSNRQMIDIASGGAVTPLPAVLENRPQAGSEGQPAGGQ